MINSGFGRAAFKRFIEETRVDDILKNEDERKIISAINDDCYNGEDVLLLMEAAFKAGLFLKS